MKLVLTLELLDPVLQVDDGLSERLNRNREFHDAIARCDEALTRVKRFVGDIANEVAALDEWES